MLFDDDWRACLRDRLWGSGRRWTLAGLALFGTWAVAHFAPGVVHALIEDAQVLRELATALLGLAAPAESGIGAMLVAAVMAWLRGSRRRRRYRDDAP